MAINQTTLSNKKRKRAFYKRKAFWFCLFLGGLLLAAAGGYFGYHYAQDYTSPYRERATQYDLERINDLELPSLIVDRNGREIGRFFVQNRSVIPIDEVPKIFIDALRAGEDQRFDQHFGIDPIGIARAFYLNWKAGETTQGASTITQQLARNAYDLESERRKLGESGMKRKLVEAFLAMEIEKRYDKSKILEFYLNRIYFGSGYYGIRSAALGYFGKEPRELDALESAAIVGCIKNPTNLSPLNNPEANRRSRNLVLGRMVDLGAVSRRQARELKQADLKLNPKPLQRGTSHLYERIAEAVGRVMGDDGLAAGGYVIRTTILAEAQEAAQQALEDSLAKAEAHPGYRRQKHGDFRSGGDEAPSYVQGACLMVDQDSGEVLVHVGGRDYSESQYDFIETGRRPLGTAFFPFIYAAALEQGMPPTLTLEDEPMDNRSVMVGGREGILGEWGMEVAAPVYEGGVTMRRALESSKIAATVRLIDKVGLENLVAKASEFGFPLQQAELLRRLAVGFESSSLKEAVRATSVFAQGGRLVPESLVYLQRIEDAEGNVIYRRQPQARETRRVISEASAWQVHDMLAGGLKRGSAQGLLDGLKPQPFEGAAKGGTTHDFGDCWFLGYNKRVACGVWTGFLDTSEEGIYPGAFSRDLAMPVWQAAMNAAAADFSGGRFTPPDDVAVVPVCSVSGERASQFCREYEEDPQSDVVRVRSTAIDEYFRKGTQELAFCYLHAGSDGAAVDLSQGDARPELDVVPVRPDSPVLLGDDPYHSELPGFAVGNARPVFVPQRTNVLDSLDLGDKEEAMSLEPPPRLDIVDE